ncbi:MAG: hypothetical protein U1D00_28210 [Mycobacterium sp.]|nr:hypothetical protein [Mycobacterium sp.]
MGKKLSIKLPDPGLPADHHRDDHVVFYHGHRGEFLVNAKVADPPLCAPITDENGNTYTVKALRDMAAAALAVADLAESMGYPVA